MALRAVPEHPKFAELKAIIGQPKGPVAGWLEMMWHFTGRFTPQGNIGKYSDQAIEAWVEWDGPPGKLIEAFIQSRWIERDPVHRLLVHDWAQHADKATKNALMRAKLEPCTPTVRTESVWSTNEKIESGTASRLPVPEPEPEPEPVPGPESTTCAAASATLAAIQSPTLEPARTTATDSNGRAITLPTLKGTFSVAAMDCVKWTDAYPGVNVLTELLQMGVWLDANPKNRKTSAGMNRFIVNWLSRAQNQARPAGGGNGFGNGNRSQQRSDGNKHALRESLSDAEIEAITRTTGGGPPDFDQRGGLQNLLLPPGSIPS